MADRKKIQKVFDTGKGIIRLIPTFIPRYLGRPGCRLRLHPDDYYAFGVERGPIKERWFSSVTEACNGDLAAPDEGMSYVAVSDDINHKILFKDFVDELGADIIGDELKEKYGTWPMFSKFFDYDTPIFHHLHLSDKHAANVGRIGKPEAYYYPYQLNNHPGQFPVTYFGFDPDVTKEEVKTRLLKFEKDDNRITEISRAFRIELGTGWYTPPGVVHAPGTYLTYEPQWNSDINAVYENVVAGEGFPYELLSMHCPEDEKRNIDYIMDLMDWEKNIDPHYRQKYFRPPVLCNHSDETHCEKWVVYANDYFSAKELTVMPGRTVTVKDNAAYGCILIQGHGEIGKHIAEAASMIRFGQMTADEFFISESAAKDGVKICNESKYEPLVMLKHFGPNHCDVPKNV